MGNLSELHFDEQESEHHEQTQQPVHGDLVRQVISDWGAAVGARQAEESAECAQAAGPDWRSVFRCELLSMAEGVSLFCHYGDQVPEYRGLCYEDVVEQEIHVLLDSLSRKFEIRYCPVPF